MLRQFSQQISWWLNDCFLWLMACFLLTSYPTYKQNTTIYQRGRNHIQFHDASTRVQSNGKKLFAQPVHTTCQRHQHPQRTQDMARQREAAPGTGTCTCSQFCPKTIIYPAIGEFKCSIPTRYLVLANRSCEQWYNAFIHAKKLRIAAALIQLLNSKFGKNLYWFFAINQKIKYSTVFIKVCIS